MPYDGANETASVMIPPEAYSPPGNGRIFDVMRMQRPAEKYRRGIAQIGVRRCLRRGYLPQPKSVPPSRIKENLKVFDLARAKEDVQLIADLKGCVGYADDPDHTPF